MHTSGATEHFSTAIRQSLLANNRPIVSIKFMDCSCYAVSTDGACSPFPPFTAFAFINLTSLPKCMLKFIQGGHTF